MSPVQADQVEVSTPSATTRRPVDRKTLQEPTQTAIKTGLSLAGMAGLALHQAQRPPLSNRIKGLVQASLVAGAKGLNAAADLVIALTNRPRPEVVALANQVSDRALKPRGDDTVAQRVAELLEHHGEPPKLGKVLTVHGLFSGPWAFDTMNSYWTQGEQNRLAGTIHGSQLHEMGLTAAKIKAMSEVQLKETAVKLGLDPTGNLFNMEFAEKASHTDTNKIQLAAASELVRRLGDGGKIDVVAHSKGGIDTRNLLSDGNDNIRSLITLGTPHQGSWVANLGGYCRWATAMVCQKLGQARGPEDAPAIGELRSGSEATQRLLNQWDYQRHQVERTFHVAGGLAPWIGDGVVSNSSAHLPGAEQSTIWGTTHRGLTKSPTAVAEVTKFLSGQSETAPANLYEPGRHGQALRTLHRAQQVQSSAIEGLRQLFR